MTDPALWLAAYTTEDRPEQRDPPYFRFAEPALRARRGCRRREPEKSRVALGKALEAVRGSLSGEAAVQREHVTFLLHCGGDDVVAQAGRAVMQSVHIGQAYGEARARCALGHALLDEGDVTGSLAQLDLAEHALGRVQLAARSQEDRLPAYLWRLRGAAYLAKGDHEEALSWLEQAAKWFEGREPWALAEVRMLIGSSRRALRQRLPALRAHIEALELFHLHGDKEMERRAHDEFVDTLCSMHSRRTRRRLRRDLRFRHD